jgi:ABC-type Fe3+ transport system permease subunit
VVAQKLALLASRVELHARQCREQIQWTVTKDARKGGVPRDAFRQLKWTCPALITGLPAAYALTRLRFRRKQFVGNWILSTILFPPVVSAIPVFILVGKLGLTDTYLAGDNYLGRRIASEQSVTRPVIVVLALATAGSLTRFGRTSC